MTVQGATFVTTNSILYFKVVTVLTQHDVKLFQQFNSGFKECFGININKKLIQAQNLYLHYFVNLILQEINRIYAFWFENNEHRRSHKLIRLWSKCRYKRLHDIKDVMTDERDIFDETLEMI